jgi:peptide/nickel transport system substrate-binding protein
MFGACAGLTAVLVAACGSGSSPTSPTGTTSSYGAAITGIVNPSTHTGGTLTFADSSAPDSFDPGNTYYAWVWNISRLWATPLVTYKSCPGPCGNTLVPGLATSLGTESPDGLTWTYHLKHGLEFEDGTPITSADIKYAVERTFDRSVMANGPSYYQVLLGGNASTYPGPYKDRAKNIMGLTAVTTPDPYTVVFHLAKPFPDFNYVVAIPQDAPVPPAKDTGSNYQLHPLSSGPYMFQSYQLNKQAVLVPNPHWKPYYDTEARQLASKIVIDLYVNAADIDNRLLAGDIDIDAAGTGVQAAARARILSSPSLMTQADDALSGFLWFAYINTKVAPLNNVACRRAIEYAANKTDQQTAYGGPVAGGAIASTVMPPSVIGYKSFDLYEALTKPTGDLVKAKQELAMCGHPSGFTTGIAYRSDRPKEVQAAQSLQAALGKVGINLVLHGYTSATYYTDFAGAPAYVHQHDLGIDMGGWAPDWPDGYGFLDEISNGNAIVPSGNTNISELNDPIVNNLFTKAANPALSDAARTAIWSQIDKEIMTQAAILPEVYAKSLLYRNPAVTNVYVDRYYGMYNYAVLGVK